MEDYAIEIDHVTIRFNMASEKVDNLKEYIIKLIKKELIFQEFLAVKDVSFKVKRGEAWALIGVNGSGKSTLLNIIGGIDQPDSGTIMIQGKTISTLKEKDLTNYRRNHLGYVFQMYNLISHLVRSRI